MTKTQTKTTQEKENSARHNKVKNFAETHFLFEQSQQNISNHQTLIALFHKLEKDIYPQLNSFVRDIFHKYFDFETDTMPSDNMEASDNEMLTIINNIFSRGRANSSNMLDSVDYINRYLKELEALALQQKYAILHELAV
jgi:hypothetical protein